MLVSGLPKSTENLLIHFRVTNGGKSVGLFGYDPRTLVYFFTFELPFGSAGTAQQLTNSITNATGSNYVQSSYTDWASCVAQDNVYLATKTLTSTNLGTSILESLIRPLGGLGSGSPGPSAADLNNISIQTDDSASGSFSSWEVAWLVMRLPTCSAPVKFNDDPRFVLTLAVVPSVRYSADVNGRTSSYFAFRDLYLGQSLASSSHFLAPYCDVFFTTAPRPLDVLFVVDNSGSMSYYQASVAALGTTIQNILSTAGIDWRIGLVTTSMYLATSGNCHTEACGNTSSYQCRYFSTDISTVMAWLTQSQSSWIGAGSYPCGSGIEKGMFSAKIMLTNYGDPSIGNRRSFMPRTSDTVASTAPANAFRQACNALIIHLGDADDQQYNNNATGIADYLTFFTAIRQQFNNGLFMAGIICPSGQTCGETQRNPRVTRTVLESWPLVQIGSISNVSTIQSTISSVFNSIVASSSSYRLTQAAAIAASVQVIQAAAGVLGPCNNSYFNVPRSRVNGFDIEQNTVVLFGGCRPNFDGQKVIVNYNYWVGIHCGDGLLQSDGVNGEQCDPGPASVTDCCDNNCKFITDPGFQCQATDGSGCGPGNTTCSLRLGLCITTACPDYCVDCGESAPNYCTVVLGCYSSVCVYQNRSCLPINCNKRTCIRNVSNSLLPGVMGDCVFITESGFTCDTDYCVSDICGVCNGANTSCADCAGIPNGPQVRDICGLCGGDGSTCCSCENSNYCSPYAPKIDACGICGGNGLSCVHCSIGGLLGLDQCGICAGYGQTCLPTFTIQVSFDTPLAPTTNCDACCQILLSANSTLIGMALSPNQSTLTCILKEACDPVADPTCLPGKTSYLTSIQQVVFEGAILTSADAASVLLTNGLISNSQYGLALLGGNPTALAPAEPTQAPSSITGSTGFTGTSASPTSSSQASPSTASPASPASPVLIDVEFTSPLTGEQLYNDSLQLQTLIDQVIAQLISTGQITGSASNYSGTAILDASAGTIFISVAPVTGRYPGGGSTCSTCTTGATLNPAICQLICTASVSNIASTGATSLPTSLTSVSLQTSTATGTSTAPQLGPPSTPTTASQSQIQGTVSMSSLAVIVGATAAAVVALVIILLILFLVCRKHKSKESVEMEEIGTEGEPVLPEEAYIEDDVQLMYRLGGGQFGNVYSGVWNGREVALKKLRDNSSKAEQEFKREAQQMRILKDCPNVVRYVKLWRDEENSLYLVMELWSEGNLNEALAKVPQSNRLPWIIDALVSTSEGLAQLHAHGIIHRDLAARNVLVRRKGSTVVCGLTDFGLAAGTKEEVSAAQKPWRTSAPESFDPTAKVTPAADIWSLGLLIWELLTETKPFPELRNIPVHFAHGQYHEDILNHHPRPDGCPDGLWSLLVDCLQVDLAKRPTIDDVRRQLAELQRQQARVRLDYVDYV